jgi:hypothetical protein
MEGSPVAGGGVDLGLNVDIRKLADQKITLSLQPE